MAVACRDRAIDRVRLVVCGCLLVCMISHVALVERDEHLLEGRLAKRAAIVEHLFGRVKVVAQVELLLADERILCAERGAPLAQPGRLANVIATIIDNVTIDMIIIYTIATAVHYETRYE